MGSDMRYYVQEVTARSHGGLMTACQKAKKKLLDLGILESDPLIVELQKAIDNGTIR